VDRREFLRLLAIAGIATGSAGCAARKQLPEADIYAAEPFGQARLMHFTDCHAQLLPVYFREPSVNLGFGDARNRPPHIVGEALLEHAGIDPGSRFAHAITHLDFVSAARRYGTVGGFAHLKTLVDRLRDEAGPQSCLLLDGGDTWQGSGTAYWTRGRDMVGACNRLGVDVMTGHWEFTYEDAEVLRNIDEFAGEFVAQNVRLTDDALFSGAAAFDEDSGHVFRPYTVRDADCEPVTFHPRLDLRHPRRRTAGPCRRGARERATRCGRPLVAQRHGRRPEARACGFGYRCDPRWTYARRRTCSGHRRQ
jgi:sulfur-oxidizing protein SoxB